MEPSPTFQELRALVHLVKSQPARTESRHTFCKNSGPCLPVNTRLYLPLLL